MLSASIRKLVGKKRCPLPMIRATEGRKEPSSWRKKRSDIGQLEGGGEIDKISSEGRPCLSACIKNGEKNLCGNWHFNIYSIILHTEMRAMMQGRFTHGCTSVSLE